MLLVIYFLQQRPIPVLPVLQALRLPGDDGECMLRDVMQFMRKERALLDKNCEEKNRLNQQTEKQNLFKVKQTLLNIDSQIQIE